MPKLIEVRSYRLKPGAMAAFHALMHERALPMLRAHGTDVVAHGPVSHETDAYFLVRAYADLADLQASQEAFYGSREWREGPREPLLACIDTFLNTVLWLAPEAIEDLRRNNALSTAGAVA